jgi:hypothetical protein
MAISCERVRDESVAERYLTHRLTDDERDTFEAHFFECATCFEELRTLEALQAELRRDAGPGRSYQSMARWAAAAAVVVALGTATWLMTRQGPEPSPPALTRPSTPAPAEPVPASAEPALDDLAMVQAPEYLPLTLRGAAGAEAAAFDAAMGHYQRKEYAQAARLLEPIAGKTSAAALYLGVARLMLDDSAGAISALEQSLAAGDPRLTAEARFLLAKAHLRARRLDAARAELLRVADLGGGRAADARALLVELDRRAR